MVLVAISAASPIEFEEEQPMLRIRRSPEPSAHRYYGTNYYYPYHYRRPALRVGTAAYLGARRGAAIGK